MDRDLGINLARVFKRSPGLCQALGKGDKNEADGIAVSK